MFKKLGEWIKFLAKNITTKASFWMIYEPKSPKNL